MLGFIVALAATVLVYQLYSPWSRLLAAEKAKATPPVQAEKPLDLSLPATNNVEQSQAWGEVRITDPGGDLRVTKVDVVPLQIEAAANQALKKVGWFSTINGAGETAHELPPPSEPRYAVYQPTVYLDELRLSDWDVMTYYAKANTEKENSFASDVYFLEVRPFREDILKMPGGENGAAAPVPQRTVRADQPATARHPADAPAPAEPAGAGEPPGAGPEEALRRRSGPGGFGAAPLRQDGSRDGEQADRRGPG